MIIIINCPFIDYSSLWIHKHNLYKTLSKVDRVSFYNTKFSFTYNETLNCTYNDLKLK